MGTMNSYEQKSRLIGVLYLHDITNARMGGTAVRNVKMFNSVVGEAAAKNVVIVTTKWDLIDAKAGEERQKELAADEQFFGNILKQGATLQPFVKGDNPMRLIEKIIKEHQRINIHIVDQMKKGMKLNETDAGKVLNKDIEDALQAQQDKHEEQMKKKMAQMKSENQDQVQGIIKMLKEGNDAKIEALMANKRNWITICPKSERCLLGSVS
jgi:hypothetical protein